MKKVILTAAIAAANLVGFAQDAATTDGFMPVKGDKTFEIQALSPFTGGSSAPFSLNNGSLRFRYFLSDKMAFRTNFSLDIANDSRNLGGGTSNSVNVTNGTSVSVTNTNTEGKVSNSTFGFSIMPGLEFHKSVAKRLDVYYGGIIDFTLKSRSAMAEITKSGRSGATGTTNDYFQGTETIELSGANFSNFSGIKIDDADNSNASLNFGTGNNPPGYNNRGFLRFGLSGVLGADYYFMKSAYLGIEVTYGLAINSNSEVKFSTKNNIQAPTITTTNSRSSEVTAESPSSSFNLIPNATAAFRLGIKF